MIRTASMAKLPRMDSKKKLNGKMRKAMSMAAKANNPERTTV
jgi:hypothetical protein